MKTFLFIVTLFVLCIVHGGRTDEMRSVVLWHGMGDTANSWFSMRPLIKHIESELPGVYVHSLQIGNNSFDDRLNGFFMNVNKQIDYAHQQIMADPKLSKGFNAIGFSQGGQFLRALAERHSDPPMYNLVTMGGQHQGVYGFPNCIATGDNITEFCEIVRRGLTLGAYEPYIQNHLVQAEYWHDPLNNHAYQTKNIFLPDINNDGSCNATYKQNILALNQFVMVMFENDTMVIPRISEHFGFYVDGSDTVEQTLQESPLYQEDWLGLKTLDQTGRLQFLQTPGEHLQFTYPWFDSNIIPYLNNTYSNDN